jgi:GDPmannose 4,6-dehydratase
VTKAAAAISLGLQHELLLGSLDVSRDWGFAGDYVDAMIRAVRHDVPDDYVIATGEAHSLSELVEAAFAAAGITDWRAHVKTDQAFVRPAEIATMVGDPSHAKRTLGWAPRVSFAELVSAMVAHDLEALGPV